MTLLILGVFWVIMVAWALLSGRAFWLRNLVTRADQPAGYWLAVVLYAFLAGICIVVGIVH